VKLAGRILIALFAASVSALLAPLGCGVDNDDRFPGLANELPNGPVLRASGAQGAASSSGSGAGGGAQNVCECAAVEFASAANDCATCINETAAAACTDEFDACNLSSACKQLPTTLANCNGSAACITDALATEPGADIYIAFLKCACSASQCSSRCAPSAPMICDLTGDGGAGGSDGGTGGSDGGDGG
jgi:hypothetical protein